MLKGDDHIYNGTLLNGQKPAASQTAPGRLILPTITPKGSGFAAVLKIGLMS